MKEKTKFLSKEVFERYQNWIKEQSLYVIFSRECHNYPQNKIPHIVHLTYEHEWIKKFL
jgi:hypothetical protein